MKRFVGVLVAAVLVLISSSVFAMRNEPNDFRGIVFGSSFDIVKNEMKLKFADKDGRKRYIRINDPLIINGMNVENIEYFYYKDRFVSADITINSFASCKSIFNSFCYLFGHPSKKEKHNSFDVYIWEGNNLLVKFIYPWGPDFPSIDKDYCVSFEAV